MGISDHRSMASPTRWDGIAYSMGWHRLLDGIVALDGIAYSIGLHRLLDGMASPTRWHRGAR